MDSKRIAQGIVDRKNVARASRVVMTAAAVVLATGVTVAAGPEVRLSVDCDAGGDLGTVLRRLDERQAARSSGPVIVELNGTCAGPILATRSDLTLRGTSAARSRIEGVGVAGDPAFRAVGVRGLVLENLTLVGGSRAIELVDASVEMRDCRIETEPAGQSVNATRSEIWAAGIVTPSELYLDDSYLELSHSWVAGITAYASVAYVQASSVSAALTAFRGSELEIGDSSVDVISAWGGSRVTTHAGYVRWFRVIDSRADVDSTNNDVLVAYDSTARVASGPTLVIAAGFANLQLGAGRVSTLRATDFARIDLIGTTVDSVVCQGRPEFLCRGASIPTGACGCAAPPDASIGGSGGGGAGAAAPYADLGAALRQARGDEARSAALDAWMEANLPGE